MNPSARKGSILLERLPEEAILYDKASDRVHCLGKGALAVWEKADGTMTIGELAESTGQEPATVSGAVEAMEKAGLMEPGSYGPDSPSRRTALGKMAVAAGAALVMTIVAPPPAAHASSAPPPPRPDPIWPPRAPPEPPIGRVPPK